MILVIPAIELKNGLPTHIIRDISGGTGRYSVFHNQPRKLCELWRRENAKSIHIMDYDSVYGLSDSINIGFITYLSHCIDVPFEFFADFKSEEECRNLLDQGIYRLILDEIALLQPDAVKRLVRDYGPSRIVFNVWIKDGKICLGNKFPDLKPEKYIEYVKSLGAKRIVYGEEAWEDENTAPDYMKLTEIALSNKIRITVANGVKEAGHLWKLNDLGNYGVDSVILGDALYYNKFPCQKIWRLIEVEVENDIID